MDNIIRNEKSSNMIRIIKGSIISIVITLLLMLLFAILLTYTNIKENTIKPVIIVISGISILIGSSISTLKINKNGILNGGLVGFLYVTCLYLISSIINVGFRINLYSIIMILVCILTGAIGGIIGVNIK